MAANRQTYIHTDIHTHNFCKCSHASVGLAQARPNYDQLHPLNVNVVIVECHSTIYGDICTPINLSTYTYICIYKCITLHSTGRTFYCDCRKP